MHADINTDCLEALLELWKQLAECLQELCVVYYRGQSPDITLLNKIHRLKEQVHFQESAVLF